MFAWNDSYLLGNPDIDAEHKALFRLAEDLRVAVDEGRGQQELTSLFARLASYTRFHFEGEERLMRQAGFPDLEEHLRQHRHLAARVSDLERDFESGKARVDAQTLQLLKRWLSHHVLESDQSVAEHLRRLG